MGTNVEFQSCYAVVKTIWYCTRLGKKWPCKSRLHSIFEDGCQFGYPQKDILLGAMFCGVEIVEMLLKKVQTIHEDKNGRLLMWLPHSDEMKAWLSILRWDVNVEFFERSSAHVQFFGSKK